jgi:hypothetical protein
LGEAERQIAVLTARGRNGENCAWSNHPEQPQHQDQDQQTAKTDIHANSSDFCFGPRTDDRLAPFQPFQRRSDTVRVIFYPPATWRIRLTFRPSAAISGAQALPPGAAHFVF